MGNLLEITESNFESEVLDAEGKILVDFWAPWCGPCKVQGPILEKLADSGELNVKFVKLNTDDNPGIAGKYGIQSIPTLIVFENGQEKDRLIGTQPENILKTKLQ